MEPSFKAASRSKLVARVDDFDIPGGIEAQKPHGHPGQIIEPAAEGIDPQGLSPEISTGTDTRVVR